MIVLNPNILWIISFFPFLLALSIVPEYNVILLGRIAQLVRVHR